MREKKPCMVITFHTTTEAMAMEKKCMENAIPGRLIPVPREITAGCGLAWKISPEEYEVQEEQMKNLGLNFEKITPMML